MPSSSNPPLQSAPAHYESQLLDHLGLVAGMVDELGLVELIDKMLPKPMEVADVSHGHAVKAMIVNGLGFVQRTLYLMPEFFQNKPVDRLVGAGIEADQLNDDLLGRTLDKIYDYGLEGFYSPLALQAVNRLGLEGDKAHLDSSSFHTDGVYNSGHPPQDDEAVIHITRGYSRDHRPELNQLVLQLICENQAGIPMLMKPLSGNSSDKTDFRGTLQAHLDQLQTEAGIHYLVADSALYTAETLPLLQTVNWITRVPETLKLAREQISQQASALMADPKTLSLKSVAVRYAALDQRWLVVYSPEAHQRALKTVSRQLLKQSHVQHKAFQQLCRESFACQTDAETAVAHWQKKHKLLDIHELRFIREPHYRGRGRPADGVAPDYYEVRIEGAVATPIADYQQRIARKSCFIIATNEQDQTVLSDTALLALYKEQQTVERGFRFLKDPQFMASSLFLKSVKRVMALTVIMTLCLMVYAALEYRIRKALYEAEETFPNQLGKRVMNPTARWIFQYFTGIHLLIINDEQALVLNMDEEHQRIVRLLGMPYQQIYSSNQR